MNADELPELEKFCEDCNGRGLKYNDEGGMDDCPSCHGCRYVPTEEGIRILRLMRHNLFVSAVISFAHQPPEQHMP